MKHRIFVMALLFIYWSEVKGQTAINKSFISPGDIMPTVIVSDVLNHDSTRLNLESFKGKLLILNFWSFSCYSCIEKFPELESLQKKYEDSIQIILVNNNTPQATLDFFEKRKKSLRMPDLPMITNDTVLSKYFPRNYSPWLVWIDLAGKVRYITDEIADEFVQQYFRNEKIKLNQRQFLHGWKAYTPVVEQVPNQWMSYLRSYSYISACISGAQIGDVTPEFGEWKPGFIRLSQYCRPIMWLLQLAYSENEKKNFYSRNKVILEVTDTLQFTMRNKKLSSLDFDEWEAKNTYNYDRVVAKENAANMYAMMRKDVEDFFNLEVRIEKRYIDCLALIRTGSTKKLGSLEEISSGMDSLFIRNNTPFNIFVSRLQFIFNSVHKVSAPIIDQTNYHGNINISLNTSLISADFKSFRKQLQKNGLDLVQKKCLQDVLVIRQKTKKE